MILLCFELDVEVVHIFPAHSALRSHSSANKADDKILAMSWRDYLSIFVYLHGLVNMENAYMNMHGASTQLKKKTYFQKIKKSKKH